MEVVLGQIVSATLFVLPLVTFWAARARRSTEPWELALDVPLALGADVLTALALSLLLPVDLATLVSRALWLAALCAVLWRRRKDPPARPSAIGAGACLGFGLATAITLAICMPITRGYAVWDRFWHSPLVPSLGGQKLPFSNVYGAAEALHYHVAGDVAAAMLRALSGNAMSSHTALGVAHDLVLVLLALTLALLLLSFGIRRALPIALGAVAVLLHGPIPLRGNLGGDFDGFSYHLFLSLSYRPHVPLAALLLVGFIGALSIRLLAPERFPPRRAAIFLVVVTALLAIADEASVGLVGLALGIAWLQNPNILGLGRLRGFGLMAALAVAVVLPNVLFSGSLAPGTPVQRTAWLSAAAMPAVVGAQSLPLATREGKIAFLFDYLPFTVAWLGVAVAALQARKKRVFSLAIFSGVLVFLCGVLVTHLRINDVGIEAQRFFVAPFLATIVIGLSLLPELAPGSFARIAILFALVVPPVFTLRWVFQGRPGYMKGYEEGPANGWRDGGWANVETTRLSCRKVAGARIGDRPRPTYMDPRHHYLYSSCRPVFSAGILSPPWPVRISPELSPIAQLSTVHREMVAPDAELDAICGVAPPHDLVCSYALDRGRERCSREGERVMRCRLTPADRIAILGGRP